MAPRENGITRFGLRNFKAFRYLEDIELKPLTLLVGANSSGKSSIFQSLLLLKQSLLSTSRSGPLKFDGDWVNLGGLSSVVSDFDTSRSVEYRFRTEVVAGRNGRKSNGQPGRIVADIGISFSAADGTATVDKTTVDLSEVAPGQALDPEYTSVTLNRDSLVVGNQALPIGELHGVDVRKPFPPISFIAQMVGVKLPGAGRVLATLFAHDLALESLSDKLSAMDYLGPVRADPRPFYPVSQDPELGPRGEGAIPYLLNHRMDALEFGREPMEVASGTLFEGLNHWLRRMHVCDGLTISAVESIAYTAAVQTPLVKSRPVNLSQVGFGISQILPVLIQGLRNPADAWILFEQPEIHLHPRLQGELGDFFLSCAHAGKTLMVETHSDHMVHRIRRRIAEDPTGELANLVQILFVHPGTEEDPGSYVEPLRVAPDGSIENWPEDFLQDAADEAWAILRARQARNQQAAQ